MPQIDISDLPVKYIDIIYREITTEPANQDKA